MFKLSRKLLADVRKFPELARDARTVAAGISTEIRGEKFRADFGLFLRRKWPPLTHQEARFYAANAATLFLLAVAVAFQVGRSWPTISAIPLSILAGSLLICALLCWYRLSPPQSSTSEEQS